MSTKQAPARLYVLLARKFPVGVIFRRGPSKWVEVLRWNTATDEVEAGQWFHGRIYERRCDLSPDGRLLVYFANKFSRARLAAGHPYSYAWTAVSRPPHLTALGLWPKRDCWHGGGLFDANDALELNHRPAVAQHHPDHAPPKRFRVSPNPDAYGEDWPIWSRRMTRDGWTLAQQGHFEVTPRGWHTRRTEIWKRAWPGAAGAGRRLVLTVLGVDLRRIGGNLVETFHVALAPSVKWWKRLRPPPAESSTVQIPDASWADFDQRGRLVFARGGSLLSAEVEGGALRERLIADVEAHAPREVPPPLEAKHWP
jgi:hypothetical protein